MLKFCGLLPLKTILLPGLVPVSVSRPVPLIVKSPPTLMVVLPEPWLRSNVPPVHEKSPATVSVSALLPLLNRKEPLPVLATVKSPLTVVGFPPRLTAAV